MSGLQDVPLFPLNTVLFPGGRLPLKVFEQRYMAMAKNCLKDDSPFGVCLIASGRETGAPALPHKVGTLARIEAWDMPQLGILHIECRGEQRFRILSRRVETSGLQRADIELADLPTTPLDAHHAFFATLLSRIIDNIDAPEFLQPYRLDDANWITYRLAEMLPLAPALRQQLLETDGQCERFDILRRFLQDKGLLKPLK